MNKSTALELMKNDDVFITHNTFDKNEYLSYENTDYAGKPIEDEEDCYVLWVHGKGKYHQRYEMWEITKALSDKKYDKGWSVYNGTI